MIERYNRVASAVVVAQLVQWLLLIQRSAVRIQSWAKNYIEHLLSTVSKK